MPGAHFLVHRECISDGISNELDNDEKDQEEFAEWKANKEVANA